MDKKAAFPIYNLVFYASIGISVLLIVLMIAGSGTDSSPRNITLPDPTLIGREPGELKPESSQIDEPRESVRSPITVSLTEEKLSTLLQDTVSDLLPVHQISVRLPDKSTLWLGGSMKKKELLAWIEHTGADIGRSAKNILGFAPSTLSFDARLTIAFTDGTLRITPSSLRVMNVSLPTSLLPEETGAIIGQAVQSTLEEQGVSLSGIEIQDGVLTLYAK